MPTKPGTIVKADDHALSPEFHFCHPLNPNSDIYLRSLADAAGLERTSVRIGRIKPERESFVYHAHEGDEEFLYILSGRGKIEIEEVEHEIGPGDFVGFPTPSVAHHLTNPFDEELVYLMGGERTGLDVAHFPRLKKKAVTTSQGFFFVDDTAFSPIDVAAAFPDGIPPVMMPKSDSPETAEEEEETGGDLARSITDRVLALVDGDGRADPETVRRAVQDLLSGEPG